MAIPAKQKRLLNKMQFDHIEQIVKTRGRIKSDEVWKQEKKRATPLRPLFIWDKTAAWEQYNLNRARQIIKYYSVMVEKPENKLVHVPAPNIEKGDSRVGEYKPVHSVVLVQSEFDRAYDEALQQLSSAKKAVELLDDALKASKQGKDKKENMTRLALALKALHTAETALQQMH